MNNTAVAVVAKPTTILASNNVLSASQGNPEQVLAFARQAAKALISVVNSQSEKIIINGEQYLTFESWQTVARFYNVTVGSEWCKPMMKDNKIFGYEAKAVAYKDGVIVSSAEAFCSREEPNWSTKPSFQLKSMAQTRASAKCLRNIFAWVVVLSGCKTTPAEEMVEYEQPAGNVNISENFRGWEDRDKITEKQDRLLRNLILEKVEPEEEREAMLAQLQNLTKHDASEHIDRLINGNV